MSHYNKRMARRERTKPEKTPAVMTAGAGQARSDELSVTFTRPVCESEQENASDTQHEIALVRRATEVLGIEHVARWMQSKIPSLANQTP